MTEHPEPGREASLQAGVDFIDHVTTAHGFGTRTGNAMADAMTDAMALPSPATRAYHEHLHEQGGQDHDHDAAELARWRQA